MGGWRTSPIRTPDIAALVAEPAGIELTADRALLRLKGRDLYWYGPILRKQLDGKAADLIARPKDESEVLRVLAARSACPSRCAAAARAVTGNACRWKAAWCWT